MATMQHGSFIIRVNTLSGIPTSPALLLVFVYIDNFPYITHLLLSFMIKIIATTEITNKTVIII